MNTKLYNGLTEATKGMDMNIAIATLLSVMTERVNALSYEDQQLLLQADPMMSTKYPNINWKKK